MEGPRAARPEELPLVEQLANTVFRGHREDAPKTMFQEYPDLYDVSNAENVRIILEDGKPVANINFLPQTLSIYGSNVSMATLGGVCTLQECRSKGYGTMLLNDCLDRMREQGVSVLHISGDRHMYRNAGSLPAGVIYNYSVSMEDATKLDSAGLTLEEYNEGLLDTLISLYREEDVRYMRPYNRFKLLLASRKFIDRNGLDRKTIFIKSEGRYVAYLMLVLDNVGKGRIPDWAGPREVIINASSKLIEAYGLSSITGHIPGHEKSVLDFCRNSNISLSAGRYPGTLKIVNFKAFMESLKPYFHELYEVRKSVV